jgi:hypothetical protein
MSDGGIRYVEWLSTQEPRESDGESWSPVWNPVGSWEDSVSYRLLYIQWDLGRKPVFSILDEHVDAEVSGHVESRLFSAVGTLLSGSVGDSVRDSVRSVLEGGGGI